MQSKEEEKKTHYRLCSVLKIIFCILKIDACLFLFFISTFDFFYFLFLL